MDSDSESGQSSRQHSYLSLEDNSSHHNDTTTNTDSELERTHNTTSSHTAFDDSADESIIVQKKKPQKRVFQLDSSDSDRSMGNNSGDESYKDGTSSEDEAQMTNLNDETKMDSDEEEVDSGDEQKVNSDDKKEVDSDEEKLVNSDDEKKEDSDDERAVISNDDKEVDSDHETSASHSAYKTPNSNANESISNSPNVTIDTNKNDSSLLPSSSYDEKVQIAETDAEDEEIEKVNCYSPRTRRSITGRRSILPQMADSDDDDDIIIEEQENSSEHNDEENQSLVESSLGSEHKSSEASKDFHSTNDNDEADNLKRDRSLAPMNSSIRTPQAKRFSLNKPNLSLSLQTSTPYRSGHNIEYSDESMGSKSQNSVEIDDNSEVELKSIKYDNDDSVVLLNSSDEENHGPIANSTFMDLTSKPGASKPLVQPKIQFSKQTAKSQVNFVSRDYYQKKQDALFQLKKELGDSERIYETMGKNLPDGGLNMINRIKRIKSDISQKEAELLGYKIEEDHMDEAIATTNNNQLKPPVKDWREDLEKIQPRFVGQQGMATFNQQKTLTLNRIEKLHKAMHKCPSERDFAPQPDNLNIQLMPHQLHAIKWMRWRETQRPKGGLLADDMGLGKTLTVIGLVLYSLFGKDTTIDEEDQDTEEESDDDDVDRGYKKSYKNEGGTLIVAPASLINQWEDEVNRRVKRRKLSVLVHHGNKRKESIHSLCKYDLVITTYGIITSEHKCTGSLFRIRWDRLVLDEAHMIRNHSTAASKGCCDLHANTRWGLTGTPIQNKHMDVYSMLKFLRVTPFDDLPTFKKWINPNSEAGISRLHNILKPLLLRRTKAELQTKGELQELPVKTINIEDIELSTEEGDVYTKVLAYSQNLFTQYMAQHQQRNGIYSANKIELDPEMRKRLDQVRRFGGGDEVKSSQILVLLLRLRQICDHPGLINQMLQDDSIGHDLEDEDYNDVDMKLVKQMIGLKINESNNGEAGDSSDDEGAVAKHPLSSSNKVFDFKYPSSKCKRAIEITRRVLRETNDKVVIVSQWTSFLNIVADLLHREKVHYVELNGKTPIRDRNDIVVSFNNSSSSERVMMLSLVAGGVGLNLTGANHLILLDPHWNPQLESQAFDRVYRVGQKKNVQIYKLLCVNTVEKRIQGIQEDKLTLSDNVLTGSKQTGSKLSIQDMRKLFDL